MVRSHTQENFVPGWLFPEVWFSFFISLVSHLLPLSKFSGRNFKKILWQGSPVMMREEVGLNPKSINFRA
jgi:hypothetical protein